MRVYFQFERHNKDGELIWKSYRYRSRSFVQAFIKQFYVLFQHTSNIATTDTGGASRTVIVGTSTRSTPHICAIGPGRGGRIALSTNSTVFTSAPTVAITSDKVGIVLGTGTTAVTPTDFQLATQIADGTAASTLEYFPSSGTALTISNPTGSFKLERLFRNSSGGTITVNEIGLYTIGSTNSIPFSFCAIRDIVSPGFAIANGEYARAIYTITVTV